MIKVKLTEGLGWVVMVVQERVNASSERSKTIKNTKGSLNGTEFIE